MHQQSLTFSLDGLHTPCLKHENTSRLGVEHIKYDLLLPLHGPTSRGSLAYRDLETRGWGRATSDLDPVGGDESVVR